MPQSREEKAVFSRYVFLSVVALLPVSSQLVAPPDHRTSEYRQLVSDYRHRDSSSLLTVLTFPQTDVGSVVDAATDGASSWAADDLRAAAMLHTDACRQLLLSGQSEVAFKHLNAAIQLINRAAVLDRPSRRFASIWYASVGAVLSKLGAPARAADLAERSRTVVPLTEAESVFQKGLDQEIAACEVNDAVAADGFGVRASRPLDSAATLFADALRIDPALHLASLHLGRARLVQGSLDQARQHLEAGTHSALASERYLALLFLGSIAEKAGALDDAEARYRAALVDFKWGQSGPLALARLLSHTGREDEAREVVAVLLRPGAQVVDPLWTYLARPSLEPTSILDVLRAEIWQ